MSDVVIIGGGVIGLSAAYELAGQGVAVRVLEQSQFGQEASWAGAGILPPCRLSESVTDEDRLRAESFALWPIWSQRLREETGIDNGFVNCGGVELPVSGSRAECNEIAILWRSRGVTVEEWSGAELQQREPGLNRELERAVALPELCQVRNPRHLKALIAGCARRGVELSPGTPVIGFEQSGTRVVAVQTPHGDVSADQFVVCGGAWSRSLLAQAGVEFSLEPVRGQMVLLNALPLPTRRVIEVGPRYVVPRADGRVLIGSTEERVGFDKSNTAEAIGELIRFGTELVPALKSARLERCWSGLRPHRPSGEPFIGRAVSNGEPRENLFVAAGHFRLGLTLSPVTAVRVRQLLLPDAGLRSKE